MTQNHWENPKKYALYCQLTMFAHMLNNHQEFWFWWKKNNLFDQTNDFEFYISISVDFFLFHFYDFCYIFLLVLEIFYIKYTVLVLCIWTFSSSDLLLILKIEKVTIFLVVGFQLLLKCFWISDLKKATNYLVSN